MKKYTCLSFVIIVIIILIIIVIIMKSSNSSCCTEKYNIYLTGLWVGDPEFLSQANLKDLQIFIAPKEKKLRQGYIIMTDTNGNFILNQAIEFRNTSQSSASKANKQKQKDKFNANYQTNIEDDSIFPKNIKLGVSMCDGTLSIHDTKSNKLYALLEKDLISSATAIEAYKS